MPMIDFYCPEGLISSSHFAELGSELTHAVLRAEGVSSPTAFHLGNTAAFIHVLPVNAIHTAAQNNASVVRIQVITPPAALSRAGQKQLTTELTQLAAKFAEDPSLLQRTWVLLSEAAEGGWGIAGTAYGKDEFIALAQRAREAKGV